MCAPEIFAVVGAISAITGAVVSYTMQSQQAAAERQYQEYIYNQTKTLTDANLITQFAAISERQVQEQKKAAQEISTIVQQARTARATAYASSIEGGVAGLSVDALLNDYARKESEFVLRTQAQEKAVVTQLQQEATGLSYQAAGRIAGVTPQPIAGPSALGLAASITGSAFSFFGQAENFDYFFGGGGGGGSPSGSLGMGTVGGSSMFGGVGGGSSAFGGVTGGSPMFGGGGSAFGGITGGGSVFGGG